MQLNSNCDSPMDTASTAHGMGEALAGGRALPRVMLVHNFYQQAGGEDRVVENEMRLLTERGHDVQLYSVHNKDIVSFGDRMRVFREISYSQRERDAFADALARFNPNVVHIHNFFPLLTTSIYDACHAAGVCVVQTLHNFRITCAGVYLLRDGRICMKCVDGNPYWGMVHRCYRESLAGSFAVSRMISANRSRGTWCSKVNRFIALTGSARELFVRAGVPADRIVVKPNFAPDRGAGDPQATRFGALYVGRLSPEKGVREMIQAWRGVDYPLRVLGDGPLAAELRAAAPPNVTFLGRRQPHEVIEEMRRAAFLVAFSTCLEGFPVAIAEAFSVGLPAVVSNIGALADIVADGSTGVHVPAGDSRALTDAVNLIARQPERLAAMSQMARAAYVANYSPETNYAQLRGTYESAMSAAAAAGAPVAALSVTARGLR